MTLSGKASIVLAITLSIASVPAPSWASPDVKAYLVPVLTPGDIDPNDVPPAADDRYHLEFDWTVYPTYHVEVWVNDLGDLNSGVISAYTNVTWDNGAITDAISLYHDTEFDGFTEGAINNAGNIVENFGGTDATFLGQALDQFVRVGYIDFQATGGGLISFEGEVGAGEYSVFGRDIGEVEIRGCTAPEPTSILILGISGFACFGRRRLRRT